MQFITLTLLTLTSVVSAAPLNSAASLESRDFKIEAAQRARAARRSFQEYDIVKRADYDPIILHTLCTSDAMCRKYAKAGDIPTNGNLVCQLSNKHCVQICNSGYTLRDGVCYGKTFTCGTQKCPLAPTNGFYSCSTDGNSCVIGCSNGFTVKTTAPYAGKRCVNLASDLNNCGAEGNSCPSAYTGNGIRTCNNGQCGLGCISSRYSVAYTSSGQPYCVLTS